MSLCFCFSLDVHAHFLFSFSHSTPPYHSFHLHSVSDIFASFYFSCSWISFISASSFHFSSSYPSSISYYFPPFISFFLVLLFLYTFLSPFPEPPSISLPREPPSRYSHYLPCFLLEFSVYCAFPSLRSRSRGEGVAGDGNVRNRKVLATHWRSVLGFDVEKAVEF